jgi:hypothetical protein
VLCLGGVVPWYQSIAADGATAVVSEGLTEQLFEVSLNAEALTETVLLLRQTNGRLLVAAVDLQRWRIRLPETPVLAYQGQ